MRIVRYNKLMQTERENKLRIFILQFIISLDTNSKNKTLFVWRECFLILSLTQEEMESYLSHEIILLEADHIVRNV